MDDVDANISKDTLSAEPAGTDISPVRLELMLPSEMLARIEQLAETNHWPRDEAELTVLAYGLSFITGQTELRDISERGDSQSELERVVNERVRLESRYSVMKFRAFELMKDNQIMQMRDQALVIENNGLRAVVGRLRDENSMLKQNCSGATEQPGRTDSGSPESHNTRPSPWHVRLLDRLRDLFGQHGE